MSSVKWRVGGTFRYDLDHNYANAKVLEQQIVSDLFSLNQLYINSVPSISTKNAVENFSRTVNLFFSFPNHKSNKKTNFKAEDLI